MSITKLKAGFRARVKFNDERADLGVFPTMDDAEDHADEWLSIRAAEHRESEEG
jgi:hypothetical protein